MKKIVLCIFIVITTMPAFGQGVLGVRAGLNMTDLTVKMNGVSVSMDSHTTFHAGIAYQHPIVRTLPLYLETGLYISGRGTSISAEDFDMDSDGKAKFNMLYLQVPALLSWHFDVRNISIQPVIGIYYGFGFYGKLKGVGNMKFDVFKDIENSGVKMFKRSDVGLRFGLGVTIKKHYYVGLGYDLGLLNISKEMEEGKLTNGSFFISLGYNF